MFYDEVKNLAGSGFNDDFVLLDNFLTKLPEAIDEIGSELKEICNVVFEKSDYMTPSVKKVPTIINEHFKQLITPKRDLKNESVLDAKLLYKKLDDNGLTGDSLHIKLSFLDWLWKATKDYFSAVKLGLENGLFQSLIKSLQSILGSLLKALGFNTDIFDEDFNLLLIMVEMGNNKYAE